MVDLTPIDWKAPLNGRLRSRMATPQVQFTGMDERNTPKSEQLLARIRLAYFGAGVVSCWHDSSNSMDWVVTWRS